MALSRQRIGCYWWATSKPSILNTECGAPASAMKAIVNWPRSGTACQFCGHILAYADNREQAEQLHKDGHDIHYRHQS